MYETSSCSYQTALDLKRASPVGSIVKTEDFGSTQCTTTDWASYRFHQSTFEQLKQSVEKAKIALQDRTFLGTTSAFRLLFLRLINQNIYFIKNALYLLVTFIRLTDYLIHWKTLYQ